MLLLTVMVWQLGSTRLPNNQFGFTMWSCLWALFASSTSRWWVLMSMCSCDLLMSRIGAWSPADQTVSRIQFWNSVRELEGWVLEPHSLVVEPFSQWISMDSHVSILMLTTMVRFCNLISISLIALRLSKGILRPHQERPRWAFLVNPSQLRA